MRAGLAAGVIAFKAPIVETGSVSGPLEVLGSLVPPSKLREPGDGDTREDDDGRFATWAERFAAAPTGVGVCVLPSWGRLFPGPGPDEPGAILTAGAGGLSAMAATAKEVRADGLVGPAVDAVEAGPDTCGELAAPGAGGTGLAWGTVVMGLIAGDGGDDEPAEIGVIGALAAAWGTAPAACIDEYAGAPPDAADATDEPGLPEPADVTAAAPTDAAVPFPPDTLDTVPGAVPVPPTVTADPVDGLCKPATGPAAEAVVPGGIMLGEAAFGGAATAEPPTPAGSVEDLMGALMSAPGPVPGSAETRGVWDGLFIVPPAP